MEYSHAPREAGSDKEHPRAKDLGIPRHAKERRPISLTESRGRMAIGGEMKGPAMPTHKGKCQGEQQIFSRVTRTKTA